MSSFARVAHIRVYQGADSVYLVGDCLLDDRGLAFARWNEQADDLLRRQEGMAQQRDQHDDHPDCCPPAGGAEESRLEALRQRQSSSSSSSSSISENAAGAAAAAAAAGTSGAEGSQPRYRLLRFQKARTSADVQDLEGMVFDDPTVYSRFEIERILKEISNSQKRTGGLKRMPDAAALAGCIRFVKGYYLVLLSFRVEEGEIDGHSVYSSKGCEVVPLFDPASFGAPPESARRSSAWGLFARGQDPETTMEEEFLGLFKLIDLSKSFYWSYTYNLAWSLQRNTAAQVVASAKFRDPTLETPFATDDMFVWNTFLCSSLLRVLSGSRLGVFGCPWTVPLVHGSFQQQRGSILSRGLTLTLIARRSRFYAGTRYLKRGVNDEGHVANDVEVEQIIQDHMMLASNPKSISSFVQVRGSIPTFWSQETSVAMPKPPIKRYRFDPWYHATRKHLQDLIRRYGESIIILNLVKQVEKRKRETVVGSDFKHGIELLNASLPEQLAVQYRAVDFTRLSKTDPSSLLRALDVVAKTNTARTSFFMTSLSSMRYTTVSAVCAKRVRHLSQTRSTRLESLLAKQSGETAMTVFRVPLRWSTRQNKFVPMRINTALNLVGDKISGQQQDEDASFLEQRRPSPAHADQPSASQSGDQEEEDVDSDDGQEVPYAAIISAKDDEGHVAPGDGSTNKERVDRMNSTRFIQRGVIRTNCIDCLDRTNLAQFLIGLHVLNEQLIALGIIASTGRVSTDSSIAGMLMQMYEEMGDHIAMQYGGSDAHRKAAKLVSSASSSTRQSSFYTSLQRYYSNAFTDHAKQDAINVFLGTYRPRHHKMQHENSDGRADFYLHNRDVTEAPDTTMQPLILRVGDWWAEPLKDFEKQVMAPLQTICEMPYVAFSRPGVDEAEEEDMMRSISENQLVSFDAIMQQSFQVPRQLVFDAVNQLGVVAGKVGKWRF